MEERIFLRDKDILVVFKEQNETMAQLTDKVNNFLGQEARSIYNLETLAGGVVIYALNEKSYKALQKSYIENEFEFKFYAVTVGQAKQNKGGYSAYCTKDKKSNKLIHIPQLNAGAESFGINYEILQKVQQIQIVRITANASLPETIRFAMADLNMPIFGDKLYGGDSLAKNTNTALFLVDTRLRHPTKQEYLNFRAMVPENKPWNYFNLADIFQLKLGG